MAQIFPRGATTLFRVLLAVFAVSFIGLFFLGELQRTPYISDSSITREQPIQFSHKHHVSDDGIDCRYCHGSVETSAFAGIPETQICMNCHRQIWLNSPMLAPVHKSALSGMPLRWIRVYDLPDYVYFNHSIHVNKGVGCSTCHGRVDEMALTRIAQPLVMKWCLDCHRHPERYVRPRSEIFNMQWQPPKNQDEVGKRLVAEYRILDPGLLTSCSTCHR
jgi:hypothetical protein